MYHHISIDVFLNVGRCFGLRLDGRCYTNVADEMATVVHNVLHVFCFIYGWQVEQPLWQMPGHPIINM